MHKFVLVALFLVGCAGSKIPPNEPCIIDSKNGQLICSTADGKNTYTVELLGADNYVCWSRDDVIKIFRYIRELETKRK